jgi:hypothetical protein
MKAKAPTKRELQKGEVEPHQIRGTTKPPKPSQSKPGHAKHMKAMGYK